jgi:hypothetical protein
MNGLQSLLAAAETVSLGFTFNLRPLLPLTLSHHASDSYLWWEVNPRDRSVGRQV